MKFQKYSLLLSLVVLLVSFWNRNNLSESIDILPGSFLEPRQVRTYKQPFTASVSGVNYQVEPMFEYEIQGIVVSYRLHDAEYGVHLKWNDHRNVADYCIAWGHNAFQVLGNDYKIWNQEFTCYVHTRSSEAWKKFDMRQLSNNHLISDDDYIRRKLAGVSVGDQVRIKGLLAAYSSDGKRPRVSSVVRTDTGNGACETIYVKDFEIVKSYTGFWRILMYLSGLAFLLELGWFFLSPYKPD